METVTFRTTPGRQSLTVPLHSIVALVEVDSVFHHSNGDYYYKLLLRGGHSTTIASSMPLNELKYFVFDYEVWKSRYRK